MIGIVFVFRQTAIQVYNVMLKHDRVTFLKMA